MNLSSLFNKRKVIVWLMILVTFFQVVLSSFTSINVYAEDANTKLSNYMKLAKGKTINDIDVDSLTTEELRMLGVYLSNFYIPMSTELSSSHDDDTAKENMVSALVEGASFDEDVAEVLVSAIWEMSLQSATPLYVGKEDGGEVADIGYYCNGRANGLSSKYFAYNDENYSGFEESTRTDVAKLADEYVFAENGHATATYYTFLDWFSGLIISEDKDANSASVWESLLGKTLYLFWIDGSGNKIPVYDTKFNNTKGAEKSGSLTASNLSYLMLNDNLNYKSGIGSALMCTTLDEFNSLSKEDQEKVLAVNSRLYVDCFGNILVDCGVAKYVLVPACTNPYSWYTDNNTATVGDSVNLINLFMLDEAQQGHVSATKNADAEDGSNTGFSYKFEIYNDAQALTNLDFWRVTRGSTEMSLDKSNWVNDLGEGTALYERMKVVTTEGDNQKLRFPSWSAYLNNFTTTGASKSGYAITSNAWSKNVIDDFIYFDKLNTFTSSKDDDYSIFNLLNDGEGGIFDKDGKFMGGFGEVSNFGSNVNSNEVNIVQNGSAKKYLAGIYVSYALAFYNDFSTNEDGSLKYTVNYAYAKDQFPSADGVEINWSDIEVSTDAMDTEIKSMIYYFLHPTKGVSYLATWFKNKVSGILVGWHEDMIGSSEGTSTTGSTYYLGFSGYVTLPTLSDIQWTSWLLAEYNNIIVYLIIIIFVILIAYCIVGSMTFQRAIIGTLLFGVLAFFPPLCINASVNTINSVCDNIYGDKFTYWALVQHQTYLTQLDNAIASEDKDNYLLALFQGDSDALDTNNYARVKLKWLSPKKINVVADAESEMSALTQSSALFNGIKGTLRQQLSGETFLDSENALYLYRDYADIYGYMHGGYHTDTWYDDGTDNTTKLEISEQDLEADSTTPLVYNSIDSGGISNSLWSIVGFRYDDTKEFSQKSAINSGFVVDTGDSDTTNRSFSPLLDSRVGTTLLSRNASLLDGTISNNVVLDVSNNFADQTFGLGTDEFSVTLAKINGGVVDKTNDDGTVDTAWATTTSTSSKEEYSKDDLGRFYFSLYTESPFYFFSWNILDQENSAEFSSLIGNSSDGLNSKLLDMYTINNQQYFYNYSDGSLNGFGEMRDFSNMRALFYYVIPYLRECNEGINAWSDLYGTALYEDVKVSYNNNVAEIPDFDAVDSNGNPLYTDEYIYKWWHNYNVERLFNTYSPWVDLMCSCDYAKSETISVLGEKFKVLDPLDPTSYFEKDSQGNITAGRLMVFSRSEMAYYGLTEADLTIVEQKIIAVQDTVYEDLLQLMDYADFDNEVLVTSAGMLTTFAFNQEFSQIGATGTSYTLYPQSYELKTFSYDAYLRLILAESTGEDLMDNDNASESNSYYQRIVENSSITTGIGFIILDIIAVYAIPALKLFFLIAIFFMSILMIIAAAVKLEMNIVKTTWDSLVSPLLKFSAVSIGLAWIVSLFMTDGNTSVTGRGGLTISLGDPAMVVLVMIVVNIGVLILYFKICKQCFKQVIEFSKAISTSIGGAVAGSIGKMAGLAFAGKTLSDSVARGTAKARGITNRPSATASAGTGGISGASRLGTFAKGAIFGKVADDVGDALSESKSAEKKAKYDKLAKAESKASAVENKDKSRENSALKDEQKGKMKSKSYSHSADKVAQERNALKTQAENSNAVARMGLGIQDKALAAKQKYYSTASSVATSSSKASAKAKKGMASASKTVRNSSLGAKLKMDDVSTSKRVQAKVDRAKSVKQRQNDKNYRKKIDSVGKKKK